MQICLNKQSSNSLAVMCYAYAYSLSRCVLDRDKSEFWTKTPVQQQHIRLYSNRNLFLTTLLFVSSLVSRLHLKSCCQVLPPLLCGSYSLLRHPSLGLHLCCRSHRAVTERLFYMQITGSLRSFAPLLNFLNLLNISKLFLRKSRRRVCKTPYP